jgi:ketosteroid isomerase-like protein
MSQENVETLRRAFDASSRGDLDAAVADAAPEVEYVASGAIPGQGRVARGAEEYKRFITWLRDVFDDARLVPDEFVDAGDRVLASFTLSGRGRESGVETSMRFWQVWTLRDGKFVHGQGFTTREEALEAAGLRE